MWWWFAFGCGAVFGAIAFPLSIELIDRTGLLDRFNRRPEW